MLKKMSRYNSERTYALEVMKSPVMIADRNLNIVYINRAVRELLAEAEDELKIELPGFNVATLIGSNIDIFHKRPQHQRAVLAKLAEAHNATIRIGTRSFDLIVSPLMQGGKRQGFVVEWSDAKARLQNADYRNQIEAIARGNAVISFTPDGIILDANENFSKVMGYTLDEIRGKHHRVFVDPEFAHSVEYENFWAGLKAGRFEASEYTRYAKGGKKVILNASYNPIADDKGNIVKVVKFATDVTGRVEAVQMLGDALQRLAAGDLAQRLDHIFPQNLEKLRADFNASVSQLQVTIDTVNGNASAIAAGAVAMQNAADALSRRTESQAASVEETAAALEEITTTVSDSAARARAAGDLVASTKNSAETSGQVVREAIEAMSAIETSSQQIGNIIGVIDNIAFQTNLLALNAGVEAARAGDAGKGFAVVASEVRDLAQRSANAAKEIKALINNSALQVEAGVALVNKTGAALEEIVARVQEINTNVLAIVEASQEQSAGIKSINIAVNEMDQATQQNAAMADDVSTQSRSLSGETDQLHALLKQFRTSTSQTVDMKDGGRPVRRALAVA